MQRPGPLRNIPLDRINLVDNVSHLSPFKQRPNKRPLSPNASPVCTPAKRQVLWDDRDFPAEKSLQCIMWTSHGEGPTPLPLHAALPPVVVTPRKLDFGAVRSENCCATTPTGVAQQRESSGSVAPLLSPDAMDVDDYFSPKLAPAWRVDSTPAAVTTRDSIHYPGFDVYVDRSDIFVSSPLPVSPRKSSTIAGGVSKRLKDTDKENIPPRIKLARAAKGHLEAVGLENMPVKVAHFAEPTGQPCSSLMTSAGFDYTLKSRLDTYNLADRGQGLPWLKPGQVAIDDETMEVSGLSVVDEQTGRGWDD